MDRQAPTPDYLTLTEITQLIFGQPRRQERARTAYAIECEDIAPACRAGTVRLWHRDDVPRIQAALRRIASRSREARR